MKFWFWSMTILLSFKLNSQVIEPPPLSVEDDGQRAIVTRGARDLKIEQSSTNPEDGQLKLEPAQKIQDWTSPKKVHEAQLNEKQFIDTLNYFLGKRYLQIGFGFINSRYDKVYSTLDNGSEFMWFGFARDLTLNLQVGTLIQLISDKSPEKTPNNIRAVSANLFLDYHRPVYRDSIHGLAGLHLSIGDYSTRRLSTNAQGEMISTRLKSGVIIGLLPTLGGRFYFLNQFFALDLLAQYHHYFGKPQTYIGGFSYLTRVSFLF